jgi:hypothetical protein
MPGLRPWGKLLAAAAGVLALAGIAAGLAGLVHVPLALASVVLVVSAAATVIWWRVVTPDWVQPVAWAYAERLLEAAETLAETS